MNFSLNKPCLNAMYKSLMRHSCLRNTTLMISFASAIAFAQRGVVVDETTNQPIAKAVVMQKPSWAMVLTNAQGEFDFGSTSTMHQRQAQGLRQGIRRVSSHTLQIMPELLGRMNVSRQGAIQVLNPKGEMQYLPIMPSGLVNLASLNTKQGLHFLRLGSITIRLMHLGSDWQVMGEVQSEKSTPSTYTLAKSAADGDTLLVSRFGYDAKVQLLNGTDQGTIKLKANAQAAPPGMKRLSGATYMMGSRRDPVASPEHEVTVSSFYIDSVEVTQADWLLLMDDAFKSRGTDGYELNFGPQYAAMNMTWYEAVLYCNARSKRDGLDTVFTYIGRSPDPRLGSFILDSLKVNVHAKGYRIPTEAEWEYGCKAGSDSDTFWGTNSAIADSAKIYTWYSNNSRGAGGTLTNWPVANKKSNRFGLYDILGNGREYVLDSRLTPYPTTPNVDPYFESSEVPPSRINKGGGGPSP
jgi:formylglycine-generating enzyme required for sulfatase activity